MFKCSFPNVHWLVVLRIYIASAVFQPYRDLEAGDMQSLKFKWRGRESNPGLLLRLIYTNVRCEHPLESNPQPTCHGIKIRKPPSHDIYSHDPSIFLFRISQYQTNHLFLHRVLYTNISTSNLVLHYTTRTQCSTSCIVFGVFTNSSQNSLADLEGVGVAIPLWSENLITKKVIFAFLGLHPPPPPSKISRSAY